MFEFLLFQDTFYHSLFYNLSCIIINKNNYIIMSNYNIIKYCEIIIWIFENYFLINKFYWLNEYLNLIFLFFSYDTNFYSCFVWKYNFLNYINELLFNNKYNYNCNYIINYNNNIFIYKIIRKNLPDVPELFQTLNVLSDLSIFPYLETGEIFSYYQNISVMVFRTKRPANPNFTIFYKTVAGPVILDKYFNYRDKTYVSYELFKEMGIINYLIVNNNYLLPFMIPLDWYNNNFNTNYNFDGYLYNRLPFYWDYGLYIRIFKIPRFFQY